MGRRAAAAIEARARGEIDACARPAETTNATIAGEGRTRGRLNRRECLRGRNAKLAKMCDADV